jgi:hypothetical protein
LFGVDYGSRIGWEGARFGWGGFLAGVMVSGEGEDADGVGVDERVFVAGDCGGGLVAERGKALVGDALLEVDSVDIRDLVGDEVSHLG